MSSSDPHDLQRFLEAQEDVFQRAMRELRNGLKESHWMWFIFPQLAALGHSPTAKFYGISSLEEAIAYTRHPLLSARLAQSAAALDAWRGKRSAEEIFGTVDTIKLRSSLTLFDVVSPSGHFDRTLAGFFSGMRDERTLALLNLRQ